MPAVDITKIIAHLVTKFFQDDDMLNSNTFEPLLSGHPRGYGMWLPNRGWPLNPFGSTLDFGILLWLAPEDFTLKGETFWTGKG